MIIATATTHPEELSRFESFGRQTDAMLYTLKAHIHDNRNNIGVVPAFQKIYETNLSEDIICYVHDDVTVHDLLWIERVWAEFEADPRLAVLGFGGATGLGDKDIYKTPYDIWQLARTGYCSNQRDWEVHGTQETGSKLVAVVDGFFMAVRVEFLKQIGGWRWFPHEFHMYDVALCLKAHQEGWNVRMTGVDCTHHGGGTSTRPEYVEWLKERGRTVEADHQEPHVFVYENFREILPLRV